VIFLLLPLLLLSLVCAPLAQAASALSPTALQYSYALCTLDAQCVAHFSLQQAPGTTSVVDTTATAQVLFEEIMPVALSRRDGSLDGAMAIVEQCATANLSAGGDDAVACQYVQTMWQGIMRDLSACAHPNQVWISGHGCVCDFGKHCSDDCLGVVISDLWSFVVGLALVGIGLLVNFAWNNQHLRALTHFITELNEAFAKELYYHQAVYYLYNHIRGAYAAATARPQQQQPSPAPVNSFSVSTGGMSL
jgi:hypothetical protein